MFIAIFVMIRLRGFSLMQVYAQLDADFNQRFEEHFNSGPAF